MTTTITSQQIREQAARMRNEADQLEELLKTREDADQAIQALVRRFSADPSLNVNGTTSRRTPVRKNKDLAKATLRVALFSVMVDAAPDQTSTEIADMLLARGFHTVMNKNNLMSTVGTRLMDFSKKGFFSHKKNPSLENGRKGFLWTITDRGRAELDRMLAE